MLKIIETLTDPTDEAADIDFLGLLSQDDLNVLYRKANPIKVEFYEYMKDWISKVGKLSDKERGKIDPLVWWKSRIHKYPNLYFCARKLLAIPAQSAASERAISMLNQVITKTRCSLTASRTAELVRSASRSRNNKYSKNRGNQKNKEFPPFGLIEGGVEENYWALEMEEEEEDYECEEKKDYDDDDDDKYLFEMYNSDDRQ